MILSGLIFLPLLAIPTLIFLKKDFQIKFFYSLFSFIHFGFALGVLSRHGYLFEGTVLSKNISLIKSVGLNYSVSLSAAGLLMTVFISLLYLTFGSIWMKTDVKNRAVFMVTTHTLALLAILSSNILLTALSLFCFLWSTTFFKSVKRGNDSLEQTFIFTGLVFMIGLSLVLGILYESIYENVDLNVNALTAMRTPFVKGSLYSTQFVLSLLFMTAYFSWVCVTFNRWINLFLDKANFTALVGLSAVIYTGATYFQPLFPEVQSTYLLFIKNSQSVTQVALIAAVVVTVFFQFFKIFLKGGQNV